MERTLGVLCDKSTLFQIGKKVCQSALFGKDLDIGHELFVRDTPQRVGQLGICIAMWRRGRRAARRKGVVATHTIALVSASSFGWCSW